MSGPVPDNAASTRSAAAMRVGEGEHAWYLSATPLLTLPWLIRLHWASAAIEAIALIVAVAVPAFDFPLRRIAWPIAAAGLSNAAVAIWLLRGRALPRSAAVLRLAVDVLLLSALLELTGGPFNPFAVMLGVQVALAALTLGAAYAAALGGFVAVCYGVLIYWHNQEFVPGHHRINDFPTHLFAMWVAAAVTAELAAYFVVQASNMLARREEEIEAMREQAARTERVVSLTTLAAGAAHELSTPLGTIALASKELERSAVAQGAADGIVDDARLIRAEVARCQKILDQMSGRAGGTAADEREFIDIASFMAGLREDLPPAQAARLRVSVPDRPAPVQLPLAGFRQAVLNLVKNAFDASDGEVTVAVTQNERTLQLVVRDRGHGMAADVLRHAGDPFFTTKEPGRGLGLGLFLVRVFAERCGGTLTLQSDEGTTASLALPLDPGVTGAV